MIKPAFLPLDGSAIDLNVHPQRDAALDEIHARPSTGWNRRGACCTSPSR